MISLENPHVVSAYPHAFFAVVNRAGNPYIVYMTKKYYLVEGTVKISQYMGDRTRTKETRIVKAESEEQAREKFTKFWESKSSSYSVHYSVWDCEAFEEIE